MEQATKRATTTAEAGPPALGKDDKVRAGVYFAGWEGWMEAMGAYTVRRMGAADAGVIGAQREAMFLEAGRPVGAVAAMGKPFRVWVRERLEDGRYVGWALEWEGECVGGVGLLVVDWPPHPLHPLDARRGYLLNVYVDVAHRGKGLARRLVETACEGARALGIGYMTLHASALGRPVYERMGWVETDEMALVLEEAFGADL